MYIRLFVLLSLIVVNKAFTQTLKGVTIGKTLPNNLGFVDKTIDNYELKSFVKKTTVGGVRMDLTILVNSDGIVYEIHALAKNQFVILNHFISNVEDNFNIKFKLEQSLYSEDTSKSWNFYDTKSFSHYYIMWVNHEDEGVEYLMFKIYNNIFKDTSIQSDF